MKLLGLDEILVEYISRVLSHNGILHGGFGTCLGRHQIVRASSTYSSTVARKASDHCRYA
jgi:hypothetical protein